MLSLPRATSSAYIDITMTVTLLIFSQPTPVTQVGPLISQSQQRMELQQSMDILAAVAAATAADGAQAAACPDC